MKKLLLIIILLASSNIYSKNTVNGEQGWIVYYTSINTSFRDITFVNNNTGWAVGTSGVIVKTTTGALTGFNKTPAQPQIYSRYHLLMKIPAGQPEAPKIYLL